MARKHSILLVVVLGLWQALPSRGAALASSDNDAYELAKDLQTLAEELAEKLDSTVALIDASLSETNLQLSSQVSLLEKAWSKRISKAAAKLERCGPQLDRLSELSLNLLSSTQECAQGYGQKLLDTQKSAQTLSKLLKNAANELSGISVGCIDVDEKIPLCIVKKLPVSSMAQLFMEGGKAAGKGSALADAYSGQVFSCWKQASLGVEDLVREVITEVSQCARQANTSS